MTRSKKLCSLCAFAVILMIGVAFIEPVGAADIRLETRVATLGRIPGELILQTLTISPDCRHVAFGYSKGQSVVVSVDGKALKQYSNIGMTAFTFSPDGNRLAHPVTKGPTWSVAVDGVEGGLYDSIGTTIAFSPDSQHVAYTGRKGDKRVLVVDNKEQEEEYDAILEGTPIFSPDGKRMAYGAGKGTKWLMVVDGNEGKGYNDIAKGSVVFSPDSSLLAYAAKTSCPIFRDSSWAAL